MATTYGGPERGTLGVMQDQPQAKRTDLRHSLSHSVAAFSILMMLVLQSGCDRSARHSSEVAADCLDKICPGEVTPTPAPGETGIKLNGRWYSVPRQYVMGLSSLAFYWPSKTPLAGWPDQRPFPEQRSDFNDVAIEIFPRSTQLPPRGASTYQQLLAAEAQGRVERRDQIRPGVELWRVRRPDGASIDQMFVATDLKGPDGSPPVVGCDQGDGAYKRCTMGFRWRPDVWVGLRFSPKHASDWPEIYEEVIRVLGLLKLRE